MKRMVLINSSCGVGSTGKICTSIAKDYENMGWEVKIAYGRVEYVPEEFKKYALKIGNRMNVLSHVLYSRIFDCHGFASKISTKKFLKWLDEYHPDMLWLHNIHGYYINIEMLFQWIKNHKIEVRWTLHDCWAFTGHCTLFSVAKCERWKSQCYSCPQKKLYPSSFGRDNSKENFQRKKDLFLSVKNMTLITPSYWLADLVRQSFLGKYPIEIMYNTIDDTIFKPTESNFRVKFGLESKIVLLGVSYIWNTSKGLDDFMKLSDMVDERFQIFLVGLSRKQMKKLPKKIMGIERTANQNELAEIYTAADFFINPSVEETFGMTTVEALMCGTKAIVYSGTACEEIANKYGGIVVKKNNVIEIYNTIITQMAGT